MPGDKVRITGFARKDGKPQVLFIEISDDKGHHFTEKRDNYQAVGSAGTINASFRR